MAFKRLKLDTPRDIVKYIGRLIKDSHREGEDGLKQYRRALIASIMLKAMEAAELEERVRYLEERLDPEN